MKLLRTILKQPVKDTVVIACFALLSFSVFLLLRTLVGNVITRDYAIGIDNNHLYTFLRFIIWELTFISRIILELTLIVLVAQLIYRLGRR